MSKCQNKQVSHTVLQWPWTASWPHFAVIINVSIILCSRKKMAAGRPLDMGLAIWDYTHCYSTRLQIIAIIFSLILPIVDRKHRDHGNCTKTTTDIVAKGPNYSNCSPIPGPVVELSCRLCLNLSQFSYPQFRMLCWAGYQAEWTIKD